MAAREFFTSDIRRCDGHILEKPGRRGSAFDRQFLDNENVLPGAVGVALYAAARHQYAPAEWHPNPNLAARPSLVLNTPDAHRLPIAKPRARRATTIDLRRRPRPAREPVGGFGLALLSNGRKDVNTRRASGIRARDQINSTVLRGAGPPPVRGPGRLQDGWRRDDVHTFDAGIGRARSGDRQSESTIRPRCFPSGWPGSGRTPAPWGVGHAPEFTNAAAALARSSA